MPEIADNHLVLVLYGDVPLLRAETLRELVALASDRQLALLTVKLGYTTGYGRVVRAGSREVHRTEGCDARTAAPASERGQHGWSRLPLTRLAVKWRTNNAQGEVRRP